MFEITCTKKDCLGLGLGELWCFDYTFPDGYSVTDEPLMAEATAMIDRFLLATRKADAETIHITFETIPNPDYDLLLKYTRPEDDGSIYSCSSSRFPNLEGELWLCPVLDSFFPESKPEQLYVYITPERNSKA
jgi:hypothetical protein